MKFAHYLKALLLGVLFVFSTSCEKAQDVMLTPEEVTISLDIDKLSLSSANIRVRHDGSADLNWVYTLTPDLTTDADVLIDADVDKTISLTGKIVAYKGQNKSLLMPNLAPKSYYRFICKVIDPLTGQTIGKASQIEFRTRRDPDVFELNANWEITVGDRLVNTDDQMEYDNFHCSSSDEECYVLLPIKVLDFQYYYAGDIKALFEDYISSYGLSEGDSKWKNIVKSGESKWSEQRLRSGDWKLFMIGVDQQGELTGLYQEYDHVVKPEPMTAEYEKWIGTWTISNKDNNLFNITLTPSENNMWYYMGGWESGNILMLDTTDPNLMPEVFFDKTTGNLVFVSQYVNTMIDNGESWRFYFSGTFTYGNSYVLGDQVLNYRMAEASLDTDSARIEPLKFVTGGAEFMIESICYIYYLGSQLGSISMEPPVLPLTMTRVANAE